MAIASERNFIAWSFALRATPGASASCALASDCAIDAGPCIIAQIATALRVLEEDGIVPDLVVGSSVGALLGVFWASGLSAERIDALRCRPGR